MKLCAGAAPACAVATSFGVGDSAVAAVLALPLVALTELGRFLLLLTLGTALQGTAGAGAAAGTGTAQSTLGNLSFRAIVRVDVVQVTIPSTLRTKLPPQTVPPRLAGPLLNNLETE